jgi:hypothetical protein
MNPCAAVFYGLSRLLEGWLIPRLLPVGEISDILTNESTFVIVKRRLEQR